MQHDGWRYTISLCALSCLAAGGVTPVRLMAQVPAPQAPTSAATPRADSAQAEPVDLLGNWFTKYGLSLRKSFNGTKDEQSPASIFFTREPTGKDDEFTAIDVGVKVSEVELLARFPSRSLLVYPVLEYHRSTNGAALLNKAGGTGRAEFRPWGLRVPSTGSLPGTWRTWLPLIIVDGQFSRDWGANANESRFGAQASIAGARAGWPAAPIRDSARAIRARYYPYVGVDRYRYAATTADIWATVAYARLFLEVWPVTTLAQQFVQVTVDAASRQRVGQDPSLPRQLSDVAVAANVFLDGFGHVGIGVEYANGRDATARFARRERTSIALKVKF